MLAKSSSKGRRMMLSTKSKDCHVVKLECFSPWLVPAQNCIVQYLVLIRKSVPLSISSITIMRVEVGVMLYPGLVCATIALTV